MSTKIQVLLKGAHAALSQGVTFPADVLAAKRWIEEAQAELAGIDELVEADRGLDAAGDALAASGDVVGSPEFLRMVEAMKRRTVALAAAGGAA